MSFGISYAGTYPLRDFLKIVEAGEEVGLDSVWLAEEFDCADPMITAATILRATRSVHVIPGPVSPYLKHPVAIAREALALAEIAGGRLGLQLGTGDLGGLNRLGVIASRPLATMKAAIRIFRTLCRGETVSTRGIWNLSSVTLIPGKKFDIPVYLAAMGPKMISLAREEADGVALSHMMTAGFIRKSLVPAESSPESQTSSPNRVVEFIAASVADDRQTAYDQIRPSVARWLSAPFPQPVHVADWKYSDLDIDYQALHRAIQRQDMAAAGQLVSDEMIARLTASGTPADFEARVREYIDAGVDLPIIGPVGKLEAKIKTIRLAGQFFGAGN